MSAKETIKRIVDSFNSKPLLRDKTREMGEGLMLGASLADEANERSKDAEDTTKRTEEKYKEQILAQDLNPNKDPELVDLRNGNATAGERISKFEQETTAQFQQTENDLINKIGERIKQGVGAVTSADLSQDVKESMAGGSVAVVGKASVGNENLKLDSVSVDNLNLFKKRKNLFNRIDAVSGLFLNAKGIPIVNEAQYTVIKYIHVISAKGNITTNHPSTIAFYDSSYTFISRDYEIKGTRTIPDNAVFMRISVANGYVNSFQAEYGEKETPLVNFEVISDELRLTEKNFEGKTIPLTSLKEVEIGKNKFDKLNVVNGYVSMDKGDVVLSDEYKTSSFIPSESNVEWVRNYTGNYAFYDEFKKVIPINLTDYKSSDLNFTTPDRTKFIRVAIGNDDVDYLQLELGTVASEYEPYGYVIKRLLQENKENIIESLLKKKPFPSKVAYTLNKPGSTNLYLKHIDANNNIWGTIYPNKIVKSIDGETFTTVLDCAPFMNLDENILSTALLVHSSGRIIVATNKGRVLTSDFSQKTLTESFVFKSGFTSNQWGHDMQGDIILMSSYGGNNGGNPPREIYLSKDGGASWKLIFDKSLTQMLDKTNYHIHDVKFDPFSNMVIASIGDNINRQIHYSYDFGETWEDVFKESDYSTVNFPPIHPTFIQPFPDGIAFGSDELPEGISWWERDKTIDKPVILWKDIRYKVVFGNPSAGIIGTYAHRGSALVHNGSFIAVIPFRNHQTSSEGNARLYATGDSGRTWHEIFKADNDTTDLGFINALLRVENNKVVIYAHYSYSDGSVELFKANMPDFYN